MRNLLLVVQGILALNAIIGGSLLMLAPDGTLLQLPPDFMHSTLFHDYFWPGVVLFAILGIGHAVGTVLTLRRNAYATLVATWLGLSTLGWIAVQIMLTDLFWLQALIAALGLAELFAARA